MKKFLIVGCLFVFAFMASAQGGQGGQRGQMTPERRAELAAQRYERMKTELKLTDKQVADIKKIDEEFAPKQRELAEKYRDDREKMAAERTKLNEARNAKVKPLLSAEQYTKYIEFNRPRQGQGQGQGGGGGNRQN